MEWWKDILALVVAVITTVPSLIRVFGLREAAGAVADALVMPLLHVPEVNFPLARRLQCWQFSILIHSFMTILCIWKDVHTTLPRYFAPIFLLVSSIVLLGFWLWFTLLLRMCLLLDSLFAWAVFFYLMIAFTDILYFKISITLEILLIAFTVCMHALRFVAQDSFQFNRIRLLVAFVGCIPGVVAVFRLHDLFSKPDTVLVDLIVDGHILFQISTITVALFRLLDIMLISSAVIREAANYLQGKLQEFFN